MDCGPAGKLDATAVFYEQRLTMSAASHSDHKMLPRETEAVNMGRGAYDTTGRPPPNPPPKK